MARRTKKQWKDLSPRGRFGVVLAAAVDVSLKVLAWRDLARRPAAQVRGPKVVWFAVTFINALGPVAYFLLGRRKPPVEIHATHR